MALVIRRRPGMSQNLGQHHVLDQDLSQFPAQNLSRWSSRNRLHEAYLARLFVTGKPLCYKAAKILLQGGAGNQPFAKNHEGARDFSRGSIRSRDHPTIPNRWMLHQNGLHLGRCDRESLVLDHLLASVQDKKESLFIAANDISRPIPSIAENCRGCTRLSPIAKHELRSAHHQLSPL